MNFLTFFILLKLFCFTIGETTTTELDDINDIDIDTTTPIISDIGDDDDDDDEEIEGDVDGVENNITNATNKICNVINLSQLQNIIENEPIQEMSSSRNELLNYVTNYLSSNPNELLLTSNNFPDPYDDNTNEKCSYQLDQELGINVTVHFLDIDQFNDFLYFRGGNENTTDQKGPTLVSIQEPMRFLIVHTSELYVWFHTIENTLNRTGFVLTFSSFGEIMTTTTASPDAVTVPTSILESIPLTLYIPQNLQTNDTWDNMRELFCISTNAYLNMMKKSLTLEQCQPINVTYISIAKCSSSWPDADHCVIVDVAIPLFNTNRSLINIYQLSEMHLWQMWNTTGRDIFKENNLLEYNIISKNYLIFIWIGISVAIVIIFLVVLYSIWKLDFFQDYVLMSRNSDDQHNIISNTSEIDISMIPSPHQIVPSLFPNNETGLPYDYEKQPISFATSDFKVRNPGDNLPSSKGSSLNKKPIGAFSPVDYYDNKPTSFFGDHDEQLYFKGEPTTPSPRMKPKLHLNDINNNDESKT